MYCPRCGHQPVSNELRFCSYCGFRLGVVKASLADEEKTNPSTGTNALTVSNPPRHRNINIGVILMFIGSMLAILLNGRSGGFGREGGGIILTVFYAATLLLSSQTIKVIYKLLSWGDQTAERLSASQREMGFGATLMFLSTAVSAIISVLTKGRMNTDALPIAVLVTFAVLLAISPYLLRALRYLIRDESNVTTAPNVITSGSGASYERTLPSAQELPIAMIDPPRVTTAEIGLRVPSVTEHTTNLLSEK
jgi:hypothetical protein